MRVIFILLIIALFTLQTSAVTPSKGQRPLPPAIKELYKKASKIYQSGDLYEQIQERKQRLNQIHDKKLRLEAMKKDILSIQIPVICGVYQDDIISVDNFPRKLQEKLFDGPYPTGTLSEYYHENSYGQIAITGETFDWVRVPENESFYVGGAEYGARVGHFIASILDSLDESVDFSKFDNDQDGWVENMFVVHSGVDQADLGRDSDEYHVWSHNFELQYTSYGKYYTTNDVNSNGIRVKINQYSIQPEIRTSGEMVEISVFCHEFGHTLGLPDLYDIDGSSDGIGSWGLMCQNRIYYNGQIITHSPPHLTAWSKEILGWVVPIEINSNSINLEIPAVEANPIVYKIWKNGEIEPYTPNLLGGIPTYNLGKEYFLIENRQRIGFEKYLMGEGLIIYRIYNPKNLGSNNVNANEHYPGVKLVQADGKDDLIRKANSGDDSDPFPGTMAIHFINDTTKPSTKSIDDSTTMVSIYDISAEDSVMTFSANVVFPFPEFIEGETKTVKGQKRVLQGTTDSIYFKFKNIKGPADSIHFTVSCSNSSVQFPEPEFSLKNIPFLEKITSISQPIPISIKEDISSQRIEIDIRAENEHFEQNFKAVLNIGYLETLIVRANSKTENLNKINNIFDSLGYDYESLDLTEEDSSEIHIDKRKTILWFEGNENLCFQDSTITNEIRNFLDNGGNLLVSGIGIPFMLSRKDSAFLADYLGVNYKKRTKKNIIKGYAHSNLSSKDSIPYIYRLKKTDNYSLLETVGTGQAIYQYLGEKEGYAAVCNNGQNYKTITYGYALEDVNDIYSTDTPLKSIIENVQLWFQGITPVNEMITNTISKDMKVSIYPNPFQTKTEFLVYCPNETVGYIKIYNITGALVWKKEFHFQAGKNIIPYQANIKTNGIYLYHIQAGKEKIKGKITLLK